MGAKEPVSLEIYKELAEKRKAHLSFDEIMKAMECHVECLLFEKTLEKKKKV